MSIRKTIPDSVRNCVFESQNHECKGIKGFDCPWKKLYTKPPCLQLDHIHPLCDGGNDDIENLQGLCAVCHEQKTIRDSAIRVLKRKEQRIIENRPNLIQELRDRESEVSHIDMFINEHIRIRGDSESNLEPVIWQDILSTFQEWKRQNEFGLKKKDEKPQTSELRKTLEAKFGKHTRGGWTNIVFTPN